MDAAARLSDLLAGLRRLFVLTGAGISTPSGIPDYRDDDGAWKHRQPVRYLEFVRGERVRRRYWSRSLVGWRRMAAARPNAAHRALATLERMGRVHQVVTQNVDGLHQRAGARRVIDLHGRLDAVRCIVCGGRRRRAAFQRELEAANPGWADRAAEPAPDGDARLEAADLERFVVPPCRACGGAWKPDVVFFGENVPAARVARAYARLEEADGVLVVGSSLMVFSGYRFVRAAADRGLPIALLNRGTTRADDLATVAVRADCARLLPALVTTLQAA